MKIKIYIQFLIITTAINMPLYSQDEPTTENTEQNNYEQ
jgi:hypothetical protein